MTETQRRRMMASGRSGWTYWIGDEDCKDLNDQRRMGFWETPLSDFSFTEKITYQFPNASDFQFHKGIV